MSDPQTEHELAELRDLIRRQDYYILRAQDREIGIEQELKTARAGSNREPLIAELASIKASVSYRLGRSLTFPFRAARQVISFGGRAIRAIGRRARIKLRARFATE